jgi:ABC-type branched-subunit amino acid transport system substrate-binding protein
VRRRISSVVVAAVLLLSACTTNKVDEAANVAPSSAKVEQIGVELENPLLAPSTVPTTVATTIAPTSTVAVTTLLPAPTVEFSQPPITAPLTVAATPAPTPAPTPLPTPAPTRAPVTRLVPVTPTATRPAPVTKPVTIAAVISTVASASSAQPPTTRRPRATRRPRPTKKPKSTKPPVTLPPPPATVPTPVVGPGFDGNTITLTNLGTKTHPAFGPIGRMIQGELESHFAMINAKGGIGGRYKVQVRFVETGYDPTTAAAAYEATKDQSVGIASILGTPVVGALTPLLDRDGLTASPASGDADWASRESLLPIGSTYQVQAINGAEYFWQVNGKPSTVCALSIAGPYGEAGVEGIAYAGSAAGGTVGAAVRIDPTATNLLPAVQQLAAQGCKGVMLTTTPGQALTAVLTAEQAGFRPRWIWMSPTWTDQVLTPRTSKILESNSWVMGEGPSLRRDPGPDTPGLVNLVREAKAAGNPWLIEQANIGVLFGYCQALLWERVLDKAVANGDLSRLGIRRAAKEIGIVDFQGIVAPMDYSQPKRLSNGVSTVFRVDGSWLLGLVAVQSSASPSAVAYKGK